MARHCPPIVGSFKTKNKTPEVKSPYTLVCMARTNSNEGFMVYNATFYNISVISWLSVLLIEEIGEPGDNHQPAASHYQTLSHNVVSSTLRHDQDSNSQL